MKLQYLPNKDRILRALLVTLLLVGVNVVGAQERSDSLMNELGFDKSAIEVGTINQAIEIFIKYIIEELKPAEGKTCIWSVDASRVNDINTLNAISSNLKELDGFFSNLISKELFVNNHELDHYIAQLRNDLDKPKAELGMDIERLEALKIQIELWEEEQRKGADRSQAIDAIASKRAKLNQMKKKLKTQRYKPIDFVGYLGMSSGIEHFFFIETWSIDKEHIGLRIYAKGPDLKYIRAINGQSIKMSFRIDNPTNFTSFHKSDPMTTSVIDSIPPYKRALICMKNKKYEEAITYFTKIQDSAKYHGLVDVKIGICYFYLHEYENARRFIRRGGEMLETHPPEYFYYLGMTYLMDNSLSIAEANFLRLERSSPDAPLVTRAWCFYHACLSKNNKIYKVLKQASQNRGEKIDWIYDESYLVGFYNDPKYRKKISKLIK